MNSGSRKGTLRGAGCIWHYDGDGWGTDLTDRINLLTWQFGSIHQCKLFIKSDQSKRQYDGIGRGVGICLEHRDTRLDAMKHLVEWGRQHIKDGTPSVEQVFEHCFTHWGDLYRRRIDVISHVFFTIGNGYDWLDGGVICTSPESHIEFQKREERKKNFPTKEELELKELLDRCKAELSANTNLNSKTRELLEKFRRGRVEDDIKRPLPDHGEKRNFYPVSEEYSLVCNVPDNVKPDWLALVYEAAIALRDRSGDMVYNPLIHRHSSKEDIDKMNVDRRGQNESNSKIATKVVADLEKRFPQLIKK